MSKSLDSGRPAHIERLIALGARVRLWRDSFLQAWLVPLVCALLCLALVSLYAGSRDSAAVHVVCAIGLLALKGLYDRAWRDVMGAQLTLLECWQVSYNSLWCSYRKAIDTIAGYDALADRLIANSDSRDLTDEPKQLH